MGGDQVATLSSLYHSYTSAPTSEDFTHALSATPTKSPNNYIDFDGSGSGAVGDEWCASGGPILTRQRRRQLDAFTLVWDDGAVIDCIDCPANWYSDSGYYACDITDVAFIVVLSECASCPADYWTENLIGAQNCTEHV